MTSQTPLSELADLIDPGATNDSIAATLRSATTLYKPLSATGLDSAFPTAMRGAVSHTRLPVTTGGGGNIARGCVSIHSCPFPFRYIQIAVPWISLVNSNGPDIAFAANSLVQCAIEYPLVSSLTGLSNRTAFTSLATGLENFRSVEPTITGSAAESYATESMILDMGQIIPANSPFRLFTSFEWESGTSPGANTLPAGPFIGSSAFSDVYERAFVQNTSLAASSWAKTAANVGTITTTPIQSFVPMIRVGLHPALTVPLIIGSSSGFGTGEGFKGSGSFGDFRGSVEGYSGFLERWLFGKLGIGCSNISIGSDRLNYRTTLANVSFRVAMANWLNPTDLILQNYPNDISSARTSAQIQADIKTSIGFYQRAIGRSLPFHVVTPTPNITGTTATATDYSDQVVSGNRGPGSIAAQIADAVRSKASDIGHKSHIDLADAWMSSRNSGLWKADGTPDYYIGDGSHGNSRAHAGAADYFGNFNPFVGGA